VEAQHHFNTHLTGYLPARAIVLPAREQAVIAITVKDANGCTKTTGITIAAAPPAITASAAAPGYYVTEEQPPSR
jgi:hypothetical protein